MNSAHALSQIAKEASTFATEMSQLAARRERILRATSDAAECLMQSRLDPEAFDRMLAIVGVATDVSRVYLFHCHAGTAQDPLASSFAEWCGPGITPQHGNPLLHNIPLRAAGYGRWLDAFARNEPIAGPVETFPEAERPVLAEQGILSLVVLPIQTQQGLWGFIGFDDCTQAQSWPSDLVACLQVIARVLGASLDRSEYRRRTEVLFNQYEETLSNLNDVAFKASAAGNFTYLSPAWRTATGHDPEGSLGRAVLDYLHPEDRSHCRECLGGLLDGSRDTVRTEARLLGASGEARWVQASVRRVTPPDGAEFYIVGSFADISALKAAQEELKVAQQQAESANRAKSEFLATMSHELRTPLNAVIGLSESMLEMLPKVDPERARRYLGIIHQSGRQLLAQINDVIDLARIESGRIEVALEPMDLARIAAETADGLRKEATAKGLELVVLPAREALVVRADERLMRQIFRNLIGNAIKFTESGGRVVISPERRGPTASIEVRDTGIGIPSEKIDQLFKPFSQIDSSLARRHNGTGLGLVLVDRLVRANRGAVRVESQLGKGSVFTVDLPLESAIAGTVSPAQPRVRSVLLIDDDIRQHALVGDYLQDQGFSVRCHHEAAPAIRQAAQEEPGVAVVDVNLGAVSGLDVIAALRRLPHGDRLPILALTASTQPADLERCRAAGATDFLTKPVELATLLARIKALAGIPS